MRGVGVALLVATLVAGCGGDVPPCVETFEDPFVEHTSVRFPTPKEASPHKVHGENLIPPRRGRDRHDGLFVGGDHRRDRRGGHRDRSTDHARRQIRGSGHPRHQ